MNNAFFAGNLSGGGLQVASSYVNELLDDPQNSSFIFNSLIIHKKIFNNLSFKKQKKAKEFFELKIINNKNNFLNLKQQIFLNKFKIVFCIFGPLYITPFFKKFILVSGFARPDMIFNEIYQYKGLKENLKIIFSKLMFKLNTDFYIVENSFVKERLSEYFNVKKNKIFVVLNSISTEIKNKKIHKKLVNLYKKRKLNIGFLGNHYKHKRIDILIKALEHLSNNYNFDIEFLVTLQEREFTNFFEKNKKKFTIKNFGYLDHAKIQKFYQAVDICVTCSELECFSAFPLESMYFYKPIICSDYSFHSKIYKEYPFYFKGGSYLALCKKIIELKNMDNKVLKEKLNAAHNFVVNLPSANERKDQFNKIIIDISDK